MWTNKSIQICIYICISIYCIYIMQVILSYLLYKFSCSGVRCLQKYSGIFGFIFFYSFCFIEFIALSVNISNYRKYLVQCPFTLNELNYTKYSERRCDLYNINSNSRYSYQYICSYKSSKEFKYNLKKDRKSDVILCIPFKEIIDYNDIVYLFNNEYKNKEKYYCGRTKRPPDNYTFIDPENCNNKSKYAGTVVLYVFSLFQYIFFSFIIIYFNGKILKYREEFLNVNNQNNVDNRPINQDIVRRQMNRNRRLIEFGILIDLFAQMFDRNHNNINNITRCSTNAEQDNNDNNDIQKTRNIIIENKNEYSIDVDIKNYSINKDNKLSASKAITLDKIQIDSIANSEENKINNNK